jgi:hypothetical protein
MFIQIVQGKCTRRDEMHAMTTKWVQELSPGADGWLGTTHGFTDDGSFVAVVRFESQQAASANSARPEQGAWFAEMAKLFDGAPQFQDCDDVTVMLDGGSDKAGFVQVMQGRVADRDALKAMMSNTDQLHEMRPEIIGATLAIDDGDRFTQTIAFTDEASARSGEAQEMPAEIRDQLESAMSEVSYLDLREPWFATHM